MDQCHPRGLGKPLADPLTAPRLTRGGYFVEDWLAGVEAASRATKTSGYRPRGDPQLPAPPPSAAQNLPTVLDTLFLGRSLPTPQNSGASHRTITPAWRLPSLPSCTHQVLSHP
jgi:hypothetical protein